MHYDRQHDRIELSVRELCALALQGGSIDNRYPPRGLLARAAEGREVHEALRVLRESGAGAAALSTSSYHPELPLSNECRCDGVAFLVSGRADGVFVDADGGVTVEEIKSVRGLPELYARTPREADLAQLCCYGYFLAAAKGLSTITLRLTYAQPGQESDAAHVDSILTAEALRAGYIGLLHVVLPRARDMRERETTVRDAAREAVFPYPEMREAQREMILECWRDMRAGKTLFAEAPTGIGKTMATLYPAVRCLGEGKCDKIFYLTAKNAARREAFGAMKMLTEAGTPVRGCVITARESLCLCDAARAGLSEGRRLTSHCNPVACPYAKGYYDRVEAVIGEMLSSGKKLFAGLDIRAAAQKWSVCPYELALDLSERCEVVICDYNYVFSPAVSLRRYFADGIPGTDGHRYIFLVDEAHNLPDRARELYSGEVSLSAVRAMQDTLQSFEAQAASCIFPEEDFGVGNLPDEAGGRPARLTASSLDDLIGILSRQRAACREVMTTASDGVSRGAVLDRAEPVALCEAVRALTALCDRWLHANLSHPLYPAVDGFCASLKLFRTAADYYDRRFVTYTEAERSPLPPAAEGQPSPDPTEGLEVRVRLSCLDPADILRPILQKAVARVLFSATLTPADYFADILGGGRDGVTVSFDSPFPTDHLCVAVCDGISTRFEDRDASVRRIVSHIAATVSAKKGNYMVYLPSYAYLEKVYARFHKKYPSVKTVVQTPGMTYAERETFIAAFAPDATELQIGFCVLGGSFSEGVDLPGRCLIGAVIVGVGIPGLSSERNIMRDYYDERAEAVGDGGGGEGYAYAYTYPGMNHVLQAAGRVIRRDDDRGVVVLIDDRYGADPYLHLYPAHWQNMAAVGDAESLYEYLARFWASAGHENA